MTRPLGLCAYCGERFPRGGARMEYHSRRRYRYCLHHECLKAIIDADPAHPGITAIERWAEAKYATKDLRHE